MPLNDTQQVETLLKEYDTLRSEIQERLKIAYSHLGYAGAIVAFGATFLEKADWKYIAIGAVGLLLMVWISILNWTWLAKCAEQLRVLESRINGYASNVPPLLTWEDTAQKLSRGPLQLPRR
jgi:hypothetical protein